MKRLLNIQPSRALTISLGVAPFVLVAMVYLWASELRLALNPSDRLMPSLAQFGEAIARVAFTPNERSGEYLLWVDTLASVRRLLLGVALAAAIGLVFGLLNGAIPLVRAKLSPFITVLSLVPPMALLPILFVVLGLGEVAKVALIVIGIAPFLMRDLQAKTLEIPAEQVIKAQTLGASTWQTMLRVMLPQILPRLIEGVRLSLGPAWLFLISAEAIAAEQGLGYRIFLMRRYLAMDVILPYVVWITVLAFLMDWALKRGARRAFPWFYSLHGWRS